jgi:hypothetical protein
MQSRGKKWAMCLFNQQSRIGSLKVSGNSSCLEIPTNRRGKKPPTSLGLQIPEGQFCHAES